MRVFYYKKGFYFEGINTHIPKNAKEITLEQHKKICEDMSKGFILDEDSYGLPITTLDLEGSRKALEKEIEEEYNFIVQTPVQYTNGLYYEPEYSQQYYTLLQKYLDDEMTLDIWDASGKIENVKKMNKKELTELTRFLEDICEKAYQQKRIKFAKLKA